MKRIITLQDISCVGRCSITVALPVISAMGVECGILPTAVLSTHTMFKTFTCPIRLRPSRMPGKRRRLPLTEFTQDTWPQGSSAARSAPSLTALRTRTILSW